MAKSKNLVVKSNSLVEARYKLSIWESRVFAKMVTMIEKDDKEFATYKIGIRELMKFFETNSNNDFQRIKEVPESLLKKTIKIPIIDEGKQAFLITNVISSAIVPKTDTINKDSVLKLSFDPKLKPYLLELKKKFLQYDIKNILTISSPHSIRIYELLKQFESTGWRQISLEEFKEVLGIEDKYKKYNHLKSRVIRQAEKDLKKYTDIYFTFDEIKKGRKVIAFKFYIRKNKTQTPKGKTQNPQRKTPTKPTPDPQAFEEQSEALQALIKAGIRVDKAISLIAVLGEEVALNELDYAQKALTNAYNVKSETGFIITMMEKQSYTKSQAIKKAEQEAKKRKAALYKTQIALQKKQIAALRKEYTTERNKAIKTLLKDFNKAQVAEQVNERAKKKPHIQKAIKQAEKNGNTKEANDFKYGLFIKDLDKYLQSFEQYLERMYEFKISCKGNDEFLVAIESPQA